VCVQHDLCYHVVQNESVLDYDLVEALISHIDSNPNHQGAILVFLPGTHLLPAPFSANVMVTATSDDASCCKISV
jgi:hypothetical protein